MKIYAVRHGHTKMNKAELINGQIDDDPLLEEGIEHVKAALSSMPAGITHMYVSPLKRTRQTADILDNGKNIPKTFHDELMEIHFGEYQGGPYFTDEALKKKHRALQYDYGPTGEHAGQVRNRLLSFLSNIHRKHADNEAIIVTHGGIIRMLADMNGAGPLGDIKNASLHEFDVENILKRHGVL